MLPSNVQRPLRARWFVAALVGPLVGALLALAVVMPVTAFVGQELLIAASAVLIIRERRRLPAWIVGLAIAALVFAAVYLIWWAIQPTYG